jgi:4-nitrophenyl phosphatase
VAHHPSPEQEGGSSLDLSRIRGVVVDMDGVLWRGATPIDGLTAFFGFLRAFGIPFVLATNNSSKTPESYIERLAGCGVVVSPGEIITSGVATASYLLRTHAPETPVFVVGGEGLMQAIRAAGYTIVERTRSQAQVVIVGVDFDLTYDKLADAVLHIQRGARFVGTNGDVTFPAESGDLPGAGAILAAIETATGVRPDIVGKPGRPMFDLAISRLGLPPDRIVMVGDRLATDILGGRRAGLNTILVQSGIDRVDMIEPDGVRPDAVFDDIGALAFAWRANVR